LTVLVISLSISSTTAGGKQDRAPTTEAIQCLGRSAAEVVKLLERLDFEANFREVPGFSAFIALNIPSRAPTGKAITF